MNSDHAHSPDRLRNSPDSFRSIAAMVLSGKQIYQLPLIADLAHPVIAPHAPKWRCRFHRAFETMVLKRVEAAVVTTEAASELFMNRHGLQDLSEKFSCVTQGFPSRGEKSTHIGHRCSELLKIVSTGNFYEDFRLESGLQGALSRCEEAIEEYFWNRRVIKYARSIRRVAVILDGGN